MSRYLFTLLLFVLTACGVEPEVETITNTEVVHETLTNTEIKIVPVEIQIVDTGYEPMPDPLDVDDDLDGATENGGDCDDADPDLNVRDVDNDRYSTCEDDCDDTNPNANPWDPDFDGWHSCTVPADCDQGYSRTYPGAAELDSLADCMRDADDDGYGADANVGPFVTPGTDCDDANAGIHPGAFKVNDEVDNDCDGIVE